MTRLYKLNLYALLLVMMLSCAQALAIDGVVARNATTEDLLNALVWTTDREQLRSVYDVISERERAGKLDFSTSQRAIAGIVVALAEAASSPHTKGPGQTQRENGCRVVRSYCNYALELNSAYQALDTAQLDRLVVGVTHLWQRDPASVRDDLEMLLAIVSRQPLSTIAADMLGSLAVDQRAAKADASRRLLRDVLVKTADTHGLPAASQARLLEKLSEQRSDRTIFEYQALYGLDANQAPDAEVRAARLLRWFNHDRKAVRESIGKGLSANTREHNEDRIYRAALLSLSDSVAADRYLPYCQALQRLPIAAGTSDAELVALAHIAAQRDEYCGSLLLSAISRHLADRATWGKPVPGAALRDIVEPLIGEYAPDVLARDQAKSVQAIGVLGRLTEVTIAPETVDRLIGWFASGWQSAAALENVAVHQGLNERQMQRLLTLALASAADPAARTNNGMGRIMAAASFPVEFYDTLGHWLMLPENHARRGVVLEWLATALRNDKIPGSDSAERALLYHADHFSIPGFLKPLVARQGDEAMLNRLADLAIAENRADLFWLLESHTLPASVVEKFAPLMRSSDVGLASNAARVQQEFYAAGDNGVDWLIATSLDDSAPMALRLNNIGALEKHAGDSVVREALLGNLDADAAELRYAALRSLRWSNIERARLEAATLDVDEEVQREAWRQLSKIYEVSTPSKVRWRLYPGSLRAEIAAVLLLFAMVSGVIGAFTFLIAAGYTSSGLNTILVLLGGTVITAVGLLVFFIPVIASQHRNATADAVEVWALFLVIYWICIVLSWLHIFRARRRSAASAA